MASYNAISPEKLARLIGTSKAPVIVDVRDDDDFEFCYVVDHAERKTFKQEPSSPAEVRRT